MSVSINIVNKVIDKTNNECKAALDLKAMLEKSFSERTSGNIGIAYGLTLCGQDVRDIDLFLFGKLDNFVLPNYYTNNPIYKKKNLKVDGFCIAIELKEHPSNRVSFCNTHAHVEYHGSWKDATEQNEYGFAAVKKDGKWGSIDKDGNIVIEPIYNLDSNLLIDFISKWHLGQDINMNYYCEK